MTANAHDLLDFDEDLGDELPPGTTLLQGQYTISNLISSGGFGITYLAKDRLNREVVIKECFVSAYCRRSNSRVRAGQASRKAELDLIVRHFVTEAKRMATLNHPNIVGVRQVFEENDTAYIAVDYVSGKDLLKTVCEMGDRLDPAWLVQTSAKILSALGYVHDHALLHCDIAPDNILVDQDGEPRLIDFGAARLLELGVGSRNSDPLIIKDGYSPHELYFDAGNSGPWTDIYSLGATLSYCVTGKVPTPSPARLAAIVERRPDPQDALTGHYPAFPTRFLSSLDKALSVMPKDRYQSVAEWMDDLRDAVEMDDTNVRRFRHPAPKSALSLEAERPEKTEAEVEVKPKIQANLKPKGKQMAIKLSALAEINGFIGGCLVDSDTGLMMASEGGAGFDLEAASAANTEVVKAKLQAIKLLGLDDHIDDILISLGKQLHLIRPLEKTPSVFIYVALDRKAANLGMARVQVKNVEQSISM
jgi:serine/threonine protein kinase